MKKLLIIPAVLMLMVGCGNNKFEKAKQVGERKPWSGHYAIDTISIHGQEHEIIRERTSHQGGIMHSPECWCGKEGVE